VSWRSKASWFPRRRRPSRGVVETVTSVGPWSCSGCPPAVSLAPMTADVRRTPRRGTSSRMRHKAHATDAGTRDRRMRTVDASFARSFDPYSSILTTHGGAKSVSRGGAFGSASRLGKTRASGRNQHWGQTSGRCAARRVAPLPQGRGRVTSEKEEGRGLRPARMREHRFQCLHVVFQLQKSVGDDGPRISSANALQKERQGRVNGGLARSEGRRVKPSAATSSERLVAGRPHRFQTGRTGTRPRVVRECHSAVTTSPKAVQWSWGRGCNDHRIL
jgi:hypothetical protein